MNLEDTKALLSRYDIRPSKGLGQNFLINDGLLEKIVDSADIKKSDVILEIGPGIGNLTIRLAEKAAKVIAVEKDEKMMAILEQAVGTLPNIEIIQGDILSSESKAPVSGYKVVANLPYYITSPVIRKFLESNNPPDEMVLMVQKEVAQRICSKPPRMSLLAASVQFYAEAKILFYVSKKSFWPKPKVDSAVIRITPADNLRAQISPDLFFRVVKAGFTQPRKQLANNLSNGLKLDKETVKNRLEASDIQPSQRAETLTVDNWIKLAKTFG